MLQKAIQWIRENHLNGQAVPVTHKQRRPYPEVTGYYIPTLLSIGELALAEQFARWLVAVQNNDGSFSLDNPNISYVFDTGQVVRGWVSLVDRMPELRQPLQRACDWIIGTADPVSGRLMCPKPGGDWSLGARGEVNEGIHLYVLKPLSDAAKILNSASIQAGVERALSYYLKHIRTDDFASSNSLTHFYGYIQEALFELGLTENAARGMSQVARYQQDNGAVPGYYNVAWVCSTGLAQLAKVWYLLGDVVRADAAMAFLAQLQNHSGGFYGSYGVGAEYFPSEEISWAVKYAIDAECLRIQKHFDNTVHHYGQSISINDGRVKAILSEVKQAQRVLDAGCGKGRYAALIKHNHPHIDVHAIDVSDEMLRHVPKNIHAKNASIQSLPYADGSFDLVYCVEALEHVPNPDAAIQEMVRVLAPGGRLIIIDKNKALQGALQIEQWERWFDINQLLTYMQSHKLTTKTEILSYDDQPANGLFVAWIGNKDVGLNNPVSVMSNNESKSVENEPTT